jgi:hypothetical protein
MAVRLSKAIDVIGCGGPLGCETSRLPRFLDSQLTGGDEVGSLMRRPPFTSRKIPGTEVLCDKLNMPLNLITQHAMKTYVGVEVLILLLLLLLWLYSVLLGLGRFFSFLNLYTVGRPVG